MEFFIISLIKAAVLAAILLTALAYLQWVERKVIAHVQVRMGPSRVGPHGLLQPLADVIKLMTKEDLLPPYVNRGLCFRALPRRHHGADLHLRHPLRTGSERLRL